MNCDKIKIWLSDYLDDGLDSPTRLKVESHLRECEECRQALEDLKYYRSVLQQVNTIKSPDDLREKILGKVSREKPKLHVPFTKTAYYRIGLIAAAAVLILAIILIPVMIQPSQMEITYAKKVVKKGKGPPGEKRGSAEVRLIREMAELSNGKLLYIHSNDETGLVDYVEIKVPKEDYHTFAEQFNQEDIFEALPPEPPGGIRKNLKITVYYPGRRFVTGDFNGDGKDDILTHYFRGEHQGEWHLSVNETDSFGAPGNIKVHEDIQHVPVPNQMIAGDFNRDGFDDLMVGFYKNRIANDWSVVFNDKQGNLSGSHDLSFGQDSLSIQGLYQAHAADVNGDGADDFIMHFLEGELFDQWWCYVNKGDIQFAEPVRIQIHGLKDTLAGRSKIFFMDYNGDASDDLLIYWKTKHDPAWWLSLNLRNLQFDTLFHLINAYQGAYYPYIMDFNGDGYDEMIVKEGPEDVYGNWTVWSNEKGEKFRGDRKVNFGGSDYFLVGRGDFELDKDSDPLASGQNDL
jgi:hypothetical protein